MKIKREIGGIEYEFELTRREVYSAYLQQRWDNAKEDVKYYAETFLEENEDMTEDDVLPYLDDLTEKYLELRDENSNTFDGRTFELDEAFEWCLI